MKNLAYIAVLIGFGSVYEVAVNGSDVALVAIGAGIGLVVCATAAAIAAINKTRAINH
jgi:hypothetical protein